MASKFGPWEIIGSAGEGGQAHVFQVKHKDSGTYGALKRLKNLNRKDRFERELKALRAIDHPNVVKVLDENLSNNPPYIVLERVIGQTLQELGDSGFEERDLDQRINWFLQICKALRAVHDKGLVHRDLKPDNILVANDGTAKVCDFGLVFIDDEGRLTETMEQAGSRYYIPPECEEGRAEQISPATDVYSLGKLLYFLLSKGRVFARERHREVQYDLVKIYDAPQMERFNRVLDHMIAHDVSSRESDVKKLAKSIKHELEAFNRGYPLAGKFETYKCVFCRIGTYEIVFPPIAAKEGLQRQVFQSNLGYGQEGNISNEYFTFLECSECGNAQRFKQKNGGKKWFPGANK